MINSNYVLSEFEKRFNKMSYAEREQFLKEMGFSFGTPSPVKRKALYLAKNKKAPMYCVSENLLNAD